MLASDRLIDLSRTFEEATLHLIKIIRLSHRTDPRSLPWMICAQDVNDKKAATMPAVSMSCANQDRADFDQA